MMEEEISSRHRTQLATHVYTYRYSHTDIHTLLQGNHTYTEFFFTCLFQCPVGGSASWRLSDASSRCHPSLWKLSSPETMSTSEGDSSSERSISRSQAVAEFSQFSSSICDKRLHRSVSRYPIMRTLADASTSKTSSMTVKGNPIRR